MTIVTRYYRPSAIATIGTQVVQDINLPPPAPRGPRIAFKLRRTMTSEPDKCEIAVYNLAPERELAISSMFHVPFVPTTPITLAAGYGAFTSTLFRGDARTMRTHERSGADYALVVTADDGGDAISDLTVAYSTAGWTVEIIIQVALARLAAGDPIANIAPYPVEPDASVQVAINAIQPGARTRVYTGVHAGKVRDLLDEAARILQCRWWIADNVLYMAKRQLPLATVTDAIGFDRRTWLSEPQPDADGIVRADVMFDPNALPGRTVALIGRVAPGVPEPYRVEQVEITGDTRGASPWRSALVLRSIAA